MSDLYHAILADFGWQESDDRAAAEVLHRSLGRHDGFRDVGTELKHRPRAVVVGCAASLDELKASHLPAGIVVAADGATARLREIGVLPRVVVSDLDGDPEALQWAAAEGASMVVHAHGHNQDRLHMVAGLGPFVAGTYQSTPDPALKPMRNLAGFTDGDRAALLCESYGVREIVLAAFEPGASSGHTHVSDLELKQRKLSWMERILTGIETRGKSRLVRLTP